MRSFRINRRRSLTDDQVAAARADYRAGKTRLEIARSLGIAENTAGKMLRGETYPDVPDPARMRPHGRVPRVRPEEEAHAQQ